MELTLYSLSEHLTALIDTRDMVSDPAELAEIDHEIAKYAALEVAKVDSYAGYLSTCDAVVSFLKQREKEIADRRKKLEARIERLERYAVQVIEAMPRVVSKGKEKYAKLEGKEATLSLRAGSPSVVLTDEAAVPARFKTLTITVPAEAWEDHLKHYQDMREVFNTDPNYVVPAPYILGAIVKAECAIDKRAVKKAIDAGEEVPGADVKFGEPSLSR